MIWRGLLLAIGAWGLVKLLLEPFVVMVASGGLTETNHAGATVPYAVGILPVVAACLVVMAGGPGTSFSHWIVSGTLVAALVGLLDDVAGNRSARGFRGHWSSMAQGRLSTGAWKAMIITVTALIAGTALGRGWWGVLDAALVALTTNFINLLDVRPGRAAKGLALFFAATFVFSFGQSSVQVILPFVGALLAYAPVDLGARAMLGDSGANGLGFAAGLGAAFSWPFPLRALLVAALVVLHLVSERRSLSSIIESNTWLRSLDRWGR